MARTSASLPTVVQKASELAIAGPGSNRRTFLSRLAGACGLLVLPELIACNRTSFHRRVGVSMPYEAEILNEIYSDMKNEARYLQNPLRLVCVEAQGDFLKQTIDIQLFIAQGFGGVFMFVLPYG